MSRSEDLWQLVAQINPKNPVDDVFDEDGVRLEYHSDGTLAVYRKKQLIEDEKWRAAMTEKIQKRMEELGLVKKSKKVFGSY